MQHLYFTKASEGAAPASVAVTEGHSLGILAGMILFANGARNR
jgi:hypothetical protein